MTKQYKKLGNKSTWCNVLLSFNLMFYISMKTSNKAPRFLINEKIDDMNEVSITDFDINHQIRNVLRLREGDRVVLLNGQGAAFHGVIKSLTKDKTVVSKHKVDIYKRKTNVSLKIAASILKKDNFEYVLQKCTEIGVDNFQPIVSERTEKSNLNFDRLNKIIKEAFEQSERLVIPKIFPIKTLEEFLSEEVLQKQSSKIFVLEFNSPLLKISEFKNNKDITFLVGPEGGWGEEDIKIFEKFNIEKISLGDQILKAETASIAVSALMLLGE